MFRYQSPFVVNDKGKVMDVSGNRDTENQNILMYRKHGKLNQQWDVVYMDQWKGEPGKGEMNTDFGLLVEMTFFVQSKLPAGRYLDIIDNRNFAIKTRNGNKRQEWYFDQKSLTIKSRYNNQSWDQKSSGRSRDLQIWSTNS
jgi:membrane carboxypeptidase/penicillin-binding protein PbpC